jgi:hypothetical protein
MVAFGHTTVGDAFALGISPKPYFGMSLKRLTTCPEILVWGLLLGEPVEMLLECLHRCAAYPPIAYDQEFAKTSISIVESYRKSAHKSIKFCVYRCFIANPGSLENNQHFTLLNYQVFPF